MSHEDMLQLFIFLLWFGNAIYLGYTLWHSRMSVFKTRLEGKPIAIAALKALRQIVFVCLVCTTLITFCYLIISEWTIGDLIAAPDTITLLGVLRYICFYAMAILPGTFLQGLLNSLRIVDEAKYERILEVQEAAMLGITPLELRQRRKREDAKHDGA